MNRLIIALLALCLTGIASAQQKEKTKQSQDIIIKKNGSQEEKMTIVIDGDKVTINGKPVTEYDGDNIIIRKKALEGAMAPLARTMPRVKVYGDGMENFNFDFDFDDEISRELEKVRVFSDGKPQTVLGVVTEKSEKGLKLAEVTEGSAAEKAGLKEGDVITKFSGTAVSDPEKLRELVRAKKPDEEVEIAYIKAGEKKERKVKVKLGSYKPETMVFATSPRSPRPPRPPRAPIAPVPPMHDRMIEGVPMPPMEFQWRSEDGFSYRGRPQLGVRIQDTDDSSGVKVLDVHEGSLAATAGIKESDIIVNIDGKRIKDTDEAREALQSAREKSSYPLVLNRGGQVMNIEVKVPRKLKKADL